MPDTKSDQPTDEALMLRIRDANDETALASLVDRYAGPALTLADTRLRHTGRSDDAVQQAFLKIYLEKGRFDDQRPFAPWFYSILRNICLDHLRKETRYREKLKDINDQSMTNPPTAALDALDEGLAALKDDEREILMLRLVQGLSFRHIADSLGCTEDAAKKRGQRALRQLRRKLAKTKGGI